MILGSQCPACRRAVRGLCAACWAQVEFSPPGERRAPLIFAGVTRDLLLGLKYANARSTAEPFARIVAQHLTAGIAADIAADLAPHIGPIESIDLVTWAPTSGHRIRSRGYDQAELIARHVAALLGMPGCDTLRRVDRRGPQTGRTRSDRQDGPRFVARPRVRGRHVVVLDDVITTGATLAAADHALRAAGAALVTTVGVALTPDRPSSGRLRPGRSARRL